ncbi:T9SS type A sorting domain-containing protein [Flavobacterium sp. LC2016-01]|uniref:T9SS type A sorting domain-containing protein n=1 Tax=Flavobacterium sp. LC2016-01 TaxID=2675876 RepID=UPI0012BADD30|nr:T9SS type A sorting domain-containing protein [Flavobacterium sp. LC2016-01]MTH15275.1 T9SS type A sorting domain-containing protein [Flavobacterium sp. LC2016-01]
MKTKLLLLLLLANFSIYAQYTAIPDVNFEQKLIALGFDSGVTDGKVLTTNVANVTSLNLSSSNIADLTGIKDFVSLKKLDCSYNKLTSLDVSFNLNLTDLSCQDNLLTSLDITKNTGLKNLNCNTNKLDYLNLTKNISLSSIGCAQNNLSELDITKNTLLESLFCTYNKLTSIDVSKNISLTILACHHNLITSIDLTKNIALLSFAFEQNKITFLDLTKNLQLKFLYGTNNLLTNLDVSKNSALEILSISKNKVSRLNLTNNKALTSLDCSENNLISLNVKNGKNTLIPTDFNAAGNPNLSCILVDDITYSNTNWANKKDATATYNDVSCGLDYTLIPDLNFENALIAKGYDSGAPDGKVLTSNIANLTSLSISTKNITDLTGIQDFIALKFLHAPYNKLTTLDVSQNYQLEQINVDANKLTALNVSNNILLKELYCMGNQLTELNVSQNTALEQLYCYNNQISTLDVSKNLQLRGLESGQNKLTSLDLSKNTLLYYLECYTNSLTTLDVSKNTALTVLNCEQNQLLNLDVSKNTLLDAVYCGKNKITNLDFSKNTILTDLTCNDNNLYILNLKNGNNTKLKTASTKLNNNPNLSCILVDNATYSTTNWATIKDLEATFNETSCPAPAFTLIPDANFENKLIALGIDSGEPDGKVLKSKISTLTYLNIEKSNVTDLTGIEDFTGLQYLMFSSNKVNSVDLSKNLMLETLWLDENNLTNLDVSKNVKLRMLISQKNQISSIDLSQNINLTNLGISNNKLSELNLTNNKELKYINASENQLTSLDLSQNNKLEVVYINNNQLKSVNLKNGNNTLIPGQKSSLDLTNNLNLNCILVDDIKYADNYWSSSKDDTASFSLDCLPTYTSIPDVNFEQKLISLGLDSGETDGKVLTSNISNVKGLNLYYSNISDLTGIENFKALDSLNVMSNKLTRLDVSKNLTLKYLVANYNNLTEIDLSKNVALEYVIISNNSLKAIDVSKNLSLQYFTCSTNQLTDVDVSNNKLLILFNCEANQITTIDVSKNTSLTNFRCSDNPLLTNINLKNGNNGSMQLEPYVINFSKNPLLTCILVDSAIYSNEKWSGFKDATASYSTVDCAQITAIPDPAFEDKLIALKIDNDGKNGTVLNSSISSITSLNVVASNIKDLTGIKGFTSLQTLNCSANQLGALDISQNKSLTSLDCSSNKLVSLNLKNGNNKNFTSNSNFTKNSDLSCIQVDDQAYSGQNWTSFKDSTANYNVDCTIYTTLPDSSFEQKLIDLGIDKDGLNGKIATADISDITSLDLSGANITDISGIEYFTALTYLDLSNNNLSTVDVSKNTLLTKLDLNYNQLTSLDVSANKDLFNLSFAANKISSIDLSKNTKLHSLTADYNSLSKLDLTANNEIEQLSCGTNKLTILDTSNLSNLSYLSCELNQISELNLSNNIKLDILQCYSNNLSTLDLTHNTELTRLNAASNHLTTLDLSANKKLVMVYLEFNPLTSLNVQNGNNENFVLPSQTGKKSADGIKYSSFLQLKSLSCIQVDNVAYSNEHWANIKEPSTTYSSTCKQLGLEDAALNHANIYPNPTKDIVNISNVSFQKITVYDTTGKLVKTFSIHAENTDFNTINLSGLPKGVYYLYLINQNAASAKKIVIE